MYSDKSIWEKLATYSANGKDANLTKLKPSERLLKEIESFGFNMTELATVLKTQGHQLILSCAGSGKTTALVFKVIFDQKTGFATKVVEVNNNPVRIPEKTWVCTFLRSGAEELKSSLVRWQHRLHCRDTSESIEFSTLHAEFKRALNSMSVVTNIISDSENVTLLKEVVKSYALTNANGKPLNSDDIHNLQGALTYTRNRLDNKKYQHDVYDEMNIGPSIIEAVLRDWKSLRRVKGYYDFEDLQEQLYDECYVRENQEVINYLASRYAFIYIDEFQDTSQIQYALLKVYGRSAKQVVAIGDDDQTIYSWRGSYNGIITHDFIEDFSPIRNNLSINFRCPSNILNAIKPSIAFNKNRFDKDLKAAKEGGKVRYGEFVSYKSMVKSLCDLVYDDVKNGLSVAVLCRVNSDGLMPALILDRMREINFSISGDGMTLDSYIGRMVCNIVKLFTENTSPSVKAALNLLTWDSYCINNLMKVCKNNNLSIWTVDKKDLSYSCPSISQRILQWRGYKESGGEIYALKMVLEDYRVNIFTKNTQFNNVMKSVISSVETLLNYSDYETVEEFLIELNDINERLKGRRKKSSASVKIATVHEFKGKEADSVYVWNDTMGVYPYMGTEEIEDELEEERRIHYIACTRARQISTIMCMNYSTIERSMFLDEMDLSNSENISPKASGSFSKKTAPVDGLELDKNMREFYKKASIEKALDAMEDDRLSRSGYM